jgi:hypothetical protein
VKSGGYSFPLSFLSSVGKRERLSAHQEPRSETLTNNWMNKKKGNVRQLREDRRKVYNQEKFLLHTPIKEERKACAKGEMNLLMNFPIFSFHFFLIKKWIVADRNN